MYELEHQCKTKYAKKPIKSDVFEVAQENPLQKCADLCPKKIFWLQKRVDGNTCICYHDTEKGICEVDSDRVAGTLCRPIQYVRKRIDGEGCSFNSECKTNRCLKGKCRDKNAYAKCEGECTGLKFWRG